jgi:glucose uptake protein GlcU
VSFASLKNRFLRDFETADTAAHVANGLLLAATVAFSVFLFLRHQIIAGLLVPPIAFALLVLHLATEEYKEHKEEREATETRLRLEATAHHRALARVIFEVIRNFPPDADDAYRQQAVSQAIEEFRSTCDKPLPEFLGMQMDGHFTPAHQAT